MSINPATSICSICYNTTDDELICFNCNHHHLFHFSCLRALVVFNDSHCLPITCPTCPLLATHIPKTTQPIQTIIQPLSAHRRQLLDELYAAQPRLYERYKLLSQVHVDSFIARKITCDAFLFAIQQLEEAFITLYYQPRPLLHTSTNPFRL
jgi:hypothetical protein